MRKTSIFAFLLALSQVFYFVPSPHRLIDNSRNYLSPSSRLTSQQSIPSGTKPFQTSAELTQVIETIFPYGPDHGPVGYELNNWRRSSVIVSSIFRLYSQSHSTEWSAQDGNVPLGLFIRYGKTGRIERIWHVKKETYIDAVVSARSITSIGEENIFYPFAPGQSRPSPYQKEYLLGVVIKTRSGTETIRWVDTEYYPISGGQHTVNRSKLIETMNVDVTLVVSDDKLQEMKESMEGRVIYTDGREKKMNKKVIFNWNVEGVSSILERANSLARNGDSNLLRQLDWTKQMPTSSVGARIGVRLDSQL